jgi:c-di-GMP-binding flagellar brake protein YcgR
MDTDGVIAPMSASATPASATPALPLGIGTALNLQVLTDRTGARLHARVLGMHEGESIMAHVPGALTQMDLRLGDEVAVRCLAGRTVYGFKTTVIRVCTRPYPYFHLAYPGDIAQVDVRRSERVAVALSASVSGQSSPVELRDLSGSGALLVSSTPLGVPGDAFEVSFELGFDGVNRTLRLRVSVRNADPLPHAAGEEARYRCGIQFIDAPEADRLFLLGFVYERLLAVRGAAATPSAAAVQEG